MAEETNSITCTSHLTILYTYYKCRWHNKKRIYKYISIIRILFREEKPCGRHIKWKMAFLTSVGNIAMSFRFIELEERAVPVDPIYPTPPLGQDMTQGQFLSGA